MSKQIESLKIHQFVKVELDFIPMFVNWIPETCRIVAGGQIEGKKGQLSVFDLNEDKDSIEVTQTNTTIKPSPIKCGTFSQSTSSQPRLATGHFDGSLAIWDLNHTDIPIYTSKGHESIINSIDGAGGQNAGSCGPPEIVTASRDGRLLVWDVRQRDSPVISIVPTAQSKAGDCWAVRFGGVSGSEDRSLIAGFADGDLKVFDLRMNQFVSKINVGNGICSVDLANIDDQSIGKVLVTTTNSQINHLTIDLSSKLIENQTIKGHSNTVWCGRYLPNDNHYQLTTGGDGDILLWHLKQKEEAKIEAKKAACKKPIISIECNRQVNGLFAFGCLDGTLRVGSILNSNV